MVCLKSSTAAELGGWTRDVPEAVGGVSTRLFPLVIHMISTITTATLRITNCCVFFGSSPAGFGALFSTVARTCVLFCASTVFSSAIEVSRGNSGRRAMHEASEVQLL